MTKQEVLDLMIAATKDPDVETLIAVSITKTGAAHAFLSSFSNSNQVVVALAHVAKLAIDQSAAPRAETLAADPAPSAHPLCECANCQAGISSHVPEGPNI